MGRLPSLRGGEGAPLPPTLPTLGVWRPPSAPPPHLSVSGGGRLPPHSPHPPWQQPRGGPMPAQLRRASNIRDVARRMKTVRDPRYVAEVGGIVVGMEAVTEQVPDRPGGRRPRSLLAEGVPGGGQDDAVEDVRPRAPGHAAWRIQLTPDLLPADVTRDVRLRQEAGRFHPPQGADLPPADPPGRRDRDRAPAKTQSALLEAMQRASPLIEGHTLPLPRPFMVLATQNPGRAGGRPTGRRRPEPRPIPATGVDGLPPGHKHEVGLHSGGDPAPWRRWRSC